MTTQPRPSIFSLLNLPLISSLILSTFVLPSVQAYIPALPVNDTSALNLTDSSSISISWTDPPSVYSGRVSYQLQADIPTGGTTSGALVHFTEGTMGPNLTTSTPWIAYISCDANETGASQEDDIFTLARDRGAVSALLYTATSQSCLLNQWYITDFEKPLDVFATKTVQVARVIDNQWTHTNEDFYYYNGTMLNESAIDVNNSLAGNAPSYRTYLIGELQARNSTGQATPTGIPNATGSAAESGKKKTPGSMIALYVITGIISLAFILMVFVGARRAMRHPERYGRREANDQQGPQSTAGGVAQAILDTFPVIKFSRGDTSHTAPKRLSSEAHLGGVALPVMQRSTSRASDHHRSSRHSEHTAESGTYHPGMDSRPRSGSLDDTLSGKASFFSPSTSRTTSGYELQPRHAEGVTDQGREGERVEDQCPICLLDFETGDDLRVLPCEIGHVYHKACIDPWLLQQSSSCPLCRKDFNNPNPPPPPPVIDTTPTSPASTGPSPPTQSGFPRYLAWMRRERRGTSGTRRRPRAGTGVSGSSVDMDIGRGRRREADQTGPGGY